jgi:hypothetical protein
MITPKVPNVKTRIINDPNFAGKNGMTSLSMEKISAARAMGEI